MTIFIATHYQSRYRLPLFVILLPYAAHGAFVLGKWLRAPRRLRLDARTLGVGALCLLFVLLMLA